MATPKLNPRNKRDTNIVELDLPIESLPAGRHTAQSFRELNQERFPAMDSISETRSRARSQRAAQSLPALEIRHPLITFISDVTQSLRECSDQCLRPTPTIGINAATRKEVDFGAVLAGLEAGEKRFNLLSHAKSTLDPLSNVSRHMAHEASFLVRALRRNLISTSSDPAHPGDQKATSMLESMDTLAYRLHEIRLNFEDLAASLFIQASLGQQE